MLLVTTIPSATNNLIHKQNNLCLCPTSHASRRPYLMDINSDPRENVILDKHIYWKRENVIVTLVQYLLMLKLWIPLLFSKYLLLFLIRSSLVFLFKYNTIKWVTRQPLILIVCFFSFDQQLLDDFFLKKSLPFFSSFIFTV